MYIGDPLSRRRIASPNATALVDLAWDPPLRLTYRELDDRANRVAAALRTRGIGKGDRVALLAHDGVAFYDAFFACGKLGAILVPLNWRLHVRELAAQVERTEPAILFHATTDVAGQAAQALLAHGAAASAEPLSTLASLAVSGQFEGVTCEDLTGADTACLLFTGGTTGAPKAAEISHGQIAWNTFNTALADVRPTDVYLNVFPLFHAGGLFAFSVPLLILGGTVVQTAHFDAARVLHAIAREQISIFAGVPAMFALVAASPEWPAADLTSIRFCMSGGAPMPVPLIRRWRDEKGVVFRQGFGMTEFGPGVFSLPAEEAERKAGSIGRPNFFVDARIVDPVTNGPLPPDTTGELVLRGPSVMTGYFRDAEATRAAFDREGWFHTGDLARVDGEGFFTIVDRLKDMYISGGENVYPVEVEAALHEHPAVAQCAVIAVPDERWGQAGLAFVVRQPGAQVTEHELLAHAASRLARYKLPRSIQFRDALPMSGAGKVMKRALREEIAGTPGVEPAELSFGTETMPERNDG